jgi:RNA polymerase sigma-70 factor (ECF subfamily)
MTGHHSGERPLEASPAADLYDRYGALILAYLRRHTASLEDAEDLLLDIFVAALEQDQLAAVPEEARVRWLQRVARNKVVDHYRRSTRWLTVPLEERTESLEMETALAPEQVVLRQEEQDHLLEAIHQLPPLQQEVLRLRFVAGLRAADIASLLNKHESAVRKLLSRTLNLLRSRYTTVTEEQGPGRERAL